MTYDFTALKSKLIGVHEWLAKEYTGIRTGRAAPALVDSIQIDAYGSRMPLKQSASVSVEDARTLRITPYDASQVKEVERAISTADLGVGISSDGASVRVSFPELTAERRETLIKLAKDKLEEARTSVKGARDEVWSDLQKQERDGEISEDEKFTGKDAMQKIVDDANKDLDALFTKKETEIRN